MMKTLKTLTFLFLLFTSIDLVGQSIINIRLSYKVIVNDAGNRPSNATDENIQAIVDSMNQLMASYWRGYRFQLIEVEEVGGLNSLPTEWYYTNFVAEDCENCKDDFEDEAKDNPDVYKWSDSAINIYINLGTTGGICSSAGEDVIIVGDLLPQYYYIHLHEIGHYYYLCHTQGCCCGGCGNCGGDGVWLFGGCEGGGTDSDTDLLDDTIQDDACWLQNDIAFNNFSMDYPSLNVSQQEEVNNVWNNIMSYHHLNGSTLNRLTEDQLDVWTFIASNQGRYHVNDGFTLLVGGEEVIGLNGNVVIIPHEILEDAVDAAFGDDTDTEIILIKPGVYPENLTIDKQVTLRTTRDGIVVIGD